MAKTSGKSTTIYLHHPLALCALPYHIVWRLFRKLEDARGREDRRRHRCPFASRAFIARR